MKPETLETRILKRIDRKLGNVFLHGDFDDLGGYDQVGRALRKIVRDGQLVRVGQGLYARASRSITSGDPIPARGPATLQEALGWWASRPCRHVSSGPTTRGRRRKPTGRVVGVTRRVRRKLGYGGIHLSFERVVPLPY